MWVYSNVSPSIAARRLSAVVPTPSEALRWPSAWMRSASAAVRNSRATLRKPSCSAFLAKARYFWLAWLSPAKASFRFSWVVGTASSLLFVSCGEFRPRAVRLYLVAPYAIDSYRESSIRKLDVAGFDDLGEFDRFRPHHGGE